MHDDYAPSLSDWIALLSISTRLIFEKVRERAIKEITTRLDQVDPFELIGLAFKYDVEKWLKPAYRRIVTRNDLITHQEALKVPFPMAVMLMRARERYWKIPVYNHQHHYAQPVEYGELVEIEPPIEYGQPIEIGPPDDNTQPVNGTVWPRGPPDSILNSEISVMNSASVETNPPNTEPNTGQ
jgi:hypothetical protein